MGTYRSLVLMVAVCVVLAVLCAPAALAAPGAGIPQALVEPAWTVTVDGPAADSDDHAVDVKMASGGVTWVCGNVQTPTGTFDISLTKIVNGVERWTKRWDSRFHRNDVAESMALGPNGVVYTAGRSSNGHYADMILLKWSNSGVVKWARRYDGPGHKSDAARLVGVDGAGNVTVSGWTNTNNQGNEWVVRSYTGGGSARWTWMYDEGSFQTLPADQCVLGNGTIYLTGNGYRVIGRRLTSTAVSARLSPGGKLVWLRRYAGPDDRGAGSQAIARCPSGGVYVAGSARRTVSAGDGLVLRYSAAGSRTTFAFESEGAGARSTGFSDVAVTTNGRIVAVGGSSDALGTSYDGPVTIYTAAGRIAARVAWPGPNAPVSFSAVAADAAGGFSVLGGATPDEPGHPLLAVLRGSTLAGGEGWAALYGGPASNAWGAAVAVRGTTTVVAGSALSGPPAEHADQIVLGWRDQAPAGAANGVR
jgi:hypothetical protein